jgi:Cd2+/Zn2+-exporting ATPase
MPEKYDDPEVQAEDFDRSCPYCSVDLVEEKESERRDPLIIIVTSAIILASGLYLDFGLGQKLISQILFLAVAAVSGYKIIKHGILFLLKGRLTIGILITIASVGAFLIGEGAEGASVMFLYFIAEILEDYAGERARKSIGTW